MPPIHRPPHHGSIRIDVSLLERIKDLAQIDCAAPPGVIASLWARDQAAKDAGRNPEYDLVLTAETQETLDGHWLSLRETHAIQRLRGWSRTRYGLITVDARWLSAVRNVLDDFTLSFGDACDETLREYGIDAVLVNAARDTSHWPGFANVLASMAKYRMCGKCTWCRAILLRDEVDAVLDAAGFDGGVYHRAYCLGETQKQLAEHYGWKAA